ncbi:MAG: hypothetical protein WC859_05915, partial [Elusimicrobiota bacterium]
MGAKQRNLMRAILLQGSVLLLCLSMTTRVYAGNACASTGTGAVNWNNTAAWTSCGGTYPGASDPTDTATVSTNRRYTINVPITIAQLSVAVNSNGTWTISNNLTVTGNVSLSPNVATIFNISAAFTMNSDTSGSSSFNSGAFTVASGGSIDAASDFAISAASVTIQSGGSLLVEGNFSMDAGALTLTNSGSLSQFDGNFQISGGLFTPGTAKVLMDGTGSSNIIRSNGKSFYDLQLNQLGSTWLLYDPLTVTRNLTITQGTLDTVDSITTTCPTAGCDVTVGGSWLLNSANAFFTANKSTVTLNGTATGNTITTYGSDFYNLYVNGGGGYWTLQDTMTVTGLLTIGAGTLDASAGNCTFGGASASCNMVIGGSAGSGSGASWMNTGGSFIPQTSTVTFTGNLSGQRIRSNGKNFYNLYINGSGSNAYWNLMSSMTVVGNLTTDGGTLDTSATGSGGSCGGTASNIAVGKSWINAGGSFNACASTVTFNGSSSGQAIATNGNNFSNITFNGSGYWTMRDSMTVASTMTITNGTLNTGSNDISVAGTWLNNGGTFVANASTVSFNGTTTAQKITSRGHRFNNVAVTGSGYWTMQDSMTVTSTMTIAAGTLDSGSNRDISLGGSWLNTGGTYVARITTTAFTGTSTGLAIESNGKKFNNAIFNGTGYWTLLDSMTVSTMTINTGNTLELAGLGVTVSSLTLGGHLVMRGTETVTQFGTIRPNLLTGSSVTYNNASGTSMVMSSWTYRNLLINGSDGTFNAGGGLNINESLSVLAGTLDTTASNYSVAVAKNVLLPNSEGTLTLNTSSMTVGGAWTDSAGLFNANASTVVFTGSASNIAIQSGGNPFNHIQFNGSGSWVLQDSMTVTSTMTLTQGTLDTNTSASACGSNSCNLLVSGGWLTNGGTLLVRNSTITFNGSAAQMINNNNQSFGVLVDSNTSANGITFLSSFTATSLTADGAGLGSAMALYFNAGSSYTIANLALTGGDGQSVTLRSRTNGNVWWLKNTGSETVSFVDVRDSSASSSANPIYATNSKDSTNNYNWNFGQFVWTGGINTNWSNPLNWNSRTVPGTKDAAIIANAARMPTLTQNVTISTLTIIAGSSVTLNGFDLMLSSFTNAGNFLFKGTEQVGSIPLSLSGSTITYTARSGESPVLSSWTYQNLIINGSGGTFNAAGNLTIKENLTLSAGTLNTTESNYAVTVSSNWINNGGTFTVNASSVTFNATTAGHTIRSNGNSFADVLFNGSGGAWVLQDALTAANVTLTQGALDSNNLSLTVSGSWTNTSGSFNPRTNTVTFTAGDAQQIRSNGSAFNNISFTGSGSWVLADSMTVLSNLTLTNGTLDTSASNFNLAVAKTWLNNGGIFVANTSTVTFNGSTTNQTITSRGQAFNNVTFNGTGSWILQDSMTVTSTMTLTAGTLNAGSSQAIGIGGGWANTGGLFTAAGSTLTLSGTSRQIIDNRGQAFGVLIDSNTTAGGVVFPSSFSATQLYVNAGDLSAASLYFKAGSTYTIANLTLIGDSGQIVTLRSTASGQHWYLNNTWANNVIYVDAQDSDARLGKQIVAVPPSTDSGNNRNWYFGAVGTQKTKTWFGGAVSGDQNDWQNGLNWDWGIPGAQDTVIILSTATTQPALTADASIRYLTILPGAATLSLNGKNLTVSNSVTNYGTMALYGNESVSFPNPTTFNKTGSTITYSDSGSCNTFLVFSTWTYRNLVFNAGCETLNLTSASSWAINENLTISAGNVNVGSGNNAVAVTGNVSIQGGQSALAMNNSLMTVGGHWLTGGGASFTLGSSTVTFTSTNPGRTIGSAGNPFRGIAFSGTGGNWTPTDALSASVVTINNGATLTLGGNSLTVSSFTNAGTLVMVGTETVTSAPSNLTGSNVTYNSAGTSIVLSTWTYRNLNISGTGTFNIQGGSLTVNETITLTAGKLDATTSNYGIGVTKNWTNSGGLFTARSSTVTFNGTGAGNTIQSNGSPFSNVQINSADGTGSWVMQDSMTVTSTMTITSGSLDTSASNFNILLGGGWFNNGGVFAVNGSTLTLNGAVAQKINTSGQSLNVLVDSNTAAGGVIFLSSFSAAQLIINGSATGLNNATTVYFLAGATFTISNLSLTGANGKLVCLRSTTNGTSWLLNNTGTNSVSYADARDSDARPGNQITAANSSDTDNNKNWNFTGASGQRKTWWGSISTDWMNARNWDKGIPASQDSALIVSTATNMPALTAAVSISSLTINAGSTVTLSGFNLTLSSFTNAGTLALRGAETVIPAPNNLAGSSVTYNSSGASIVLSTWTYRNLIIDGNGGTFSIQGGSLTINENLTLNAGTLDATANNYTIGVAANWTNSGGTYLPQQSTVTFNGTRADNTIQSNGNPFGNVQINGAGYWALADSMTVTSTMTITAGTLDTSGLNVAVGGSWLTGTSGVFVAGSTVTFNGTNAGLKITTKGTSFNNVAFSGSGGYWTMQDSMTVTSTMTFTAGTLDANGQGILLGGGWNSTAGAFVANGSTLTFNGYYGQRIKNATGQTFAVLLDSNTTPGGVIFVSSFTANRLIVDAADVGAMTVYFNAGSSYTIANLTLTGSAAQIITLRSTTNGTVWKLTNTTSENVSFVDVQDSSATLNTIYASNSRNSGNNSRWNFGQFTWTGAGSSTLWTNPNNWNALTVPGTNDAATISPAAFMPVLTQAVSLSTLTITSGSTMTLAGYTLTLSSFTNAGALVVMGTDTVTSAPYNQAGSTVVYNSAGTSIVLSTWTYRNLIISGAGTFSILGGSLTVNENLTLGAGELDATTNNYDIGVSKTWFNTGGIFTPRTNTVTFNGSAANQTITSRGQPFYNITVNGSGSWVLADSMTVTSALTMNAGKLDTANLNLAVAGSWSNTGGLFAAQTSTVTFNGTGVANTIQSNGSPFSSVHISGTGYWTMVDSMTLTSSMTITAGTLDTAGYNMLAAGSWLNGASGTFVAGSTVTFSGTNAGLKITTKGTSFNNVAFGGSGGYWTLQDSMTVTSTMTFTAGTLDAGGQGILLGGGWNSIGGSFVTGGSTLTLNGSYGQRIKNATAQTFAV